MIKSVFKVFQTARIIALVTSINCPRHILFIVYILTDNIIAKKKIANLQKIINIL